MCKYDNGWLSSTRPATVIFSRSTMLRVRDRKSTRLNSSHLVISSVICCVLRRLELHPFPTRRSSDLFITHSETFFSEEIGLFLHPARIGNHKRTRLQVPEHV